MPGLKENSGDNMMGDFMKNEQKKLRSVITTYLFIQPIY